MQSSQSVITWVTIRSLALHILLGDMKVEIRWIYTMRSIRYMDTSRLELEAQN
jgi:hypothetical protein